MSKLRIVLTVFTNTALLFLFFVVISQNVRIERQEAAIAELRKKDYELSKVDSELDSKIIETEGRCRRITDNCLDTFLEGGFQKW